MRLIDADALIEDVRKHSESYFADDFAHYWVNKQPTIEPERKTGHWVYRPEWSKYGDVWSCSECGEKTSQSVMGEPRFKYCPMCDAKMEGERKEQEHD